MFLLPTFCWSSRVIMVDSEGWQDSIFWLTTLTAVLCISVTLCLIKNCKPCAALSAESRQLDSFSAKENKRVAKRKKKEREQKEQVALMKKEQGTLILFPSYVLHEVKPVTKGERNSLVSWVTGKQFK